MTTDLGAGVLGRVRELREAEEWLNGLPARAGRMLIEGEAGIGKSTLLWEIAGRARARGYAVLSARPSRAEDHLSFSALTDLLESHAEGFLPRIAVPQREALELALLRREARKGPPDPRTLGAATLSALRVLSEASPVVVAIDDVPWLDEATRAALAFALRRLDAEPIGALLVRRATPGALPPPLDLEAASLEILALDPLSQGSIAEVLAVSLGWRPSKPVLERVVEVAAGNPLFALELGRAMRGRPDPAPGEPLPVPQRLRDLVLSRLRDLPPKHRAVLLTAAAMRSPTLVALRAASADSAPVDDALDDAVAAGFVHVRDGRVRFQHPLFASVLYASSRASARRSAHARIAAAARDVEERAHHLSLAVAGPDEQASAELELAAASARARGATAAAADLAQRAVALTPQGDEEATTRRRLTAGRYFVDASDHEGAQRHLGPIVGSTAPAAVRAEALLLLSGPAYRKHGPPAGIAMLEDALVMAPEGTAQRARILTLLAFWMIGGEYHVDSAADHAANAMAIATSHGDETTLSWARLIFLFARLIGGNGLDREELERTPGLESRVPGLSFRGLMLTHSGDHAGARNWLETYRAQSHALGDGSGYAVTTQQLGELEWRDGDWSRARDLLGEAIQAAIDGGQYAIPPLAAGYLAVIEASAGHFDRARELLDAWEEPAAASRYVPAIIYLAWARGLLERCSGDWEASVDALRRAWDTAERYGHREHYVTFRGDLIEGLVRTEQVEEAQRILQMIEARPSAFDALAVATVLRCTAIVSAARGDLDAAIAASERASEACDTLPIPFEVARTRMIHGALLRRAKRKRAARETLEAAVAGFGSLGAAVFTDEARRELDRVGVRPATTNELTPTERRVADLTAQGKTNREIASGLSISVRTVEANLTRIYAKLGVKRRAELVRVLNVRAPGG